MQRLLPPPRTRDPIAVAYPGRDGTHSAAACERLFPNGADLRALPSFLAVAEATVAGAVDFGVLLAGSGQLFADLVDANLIDVYRFMLHPVILGKGDLLFASQSPNGRSRSPAPRRSTPASSSSNTRLPSSRKPAPVGRSICRQ